MRYTALFILFLSGYMASAQNLVDNSSFEVFTKCPVSFNRSGNLEMVSSWGQAGKGTVDYYNGCSNAAGVPDNMFGNQFAAEGDGYIGMITYSPSKRDYREYLQSKLKRPLQAGKKYCVEAYVSQADYSNYLSDGLGFLLSAIEINGIRDQVLPFKPQIENPKGHVIHQLDSWVLISDTFVADGGEQFLIVGNFRQDHEVTVMRRNLEKDNLPKVWDHAYYYIDNISVKPVEKPEDCECTIPEIEKMLADPGYPFTYVEMASITISSVYFDFDKDVLTKQEEKELDRVVKLMNKYTSYYLTVHGHTDKIGGGNYNQGLSRRRAEYVHKYLVEAGIDVKRLRIEYHGELIPAAEGEDPDSNKKNRRVEFEVLQL